VAVAEKADAEARMADLEKVDAAVKVVAAGKAAGPVVKVALQAIPANSSTES